MPLQSGVRYASRAIVVFLLMFARPEHSFGVGIEQPAAVTLQMHVKIPMRDGVHLNATVFRPEDAAKPAPVIFMLTPYPDDPSHPSGEYFARRGFNYVYVDVRGRGDSEGVFTPFAHDGPDGYDVVEWLAKQPWCDGKVAMFGGSYAGGDQWQVAALRPPHLKAIAPVASVRAGVDFPMVNNISAPYEIAWLTYTSGHSLYRAVFEDTALWDDIFRRAYRSGAPFSNLDIGAGNPNATFHTWLKHPQIDAYWRGLSPTKEQVAMLQLPTFVITGAQDADQRGTLSYYQDHITSADAHSAPNYFLVIGPWDHAGTREPKQDFEGEHFGEASLLDVLRLHAEWYRYVLSNAPKPSFFEKNMAYYVSGAGAECWKYADSLASVTQRTQRFYLNAADGADRLYHTGVLQLAQEGAAGAAWISDPSDLSHAESSTALPGEELHGDGLIFHSEPFAEDTEIDGRIEIQVSLAIDGPDADIGYRLYLITPDGKSHKLDESAFRARYRESLEREVLLKAGETNSFRISGGQWFAVRAPKSSRLRLILYSVNEPDTEKNWNSPKPVAYQSAKDAHRERITLVQTPDHPSTMTVPLGDASSNCKASAAWGP